MSKCRACLKSLRNMIPFDEKYIMYFNLLTNLNLELSPDDPQQLCKRCFKTFQHFIEFREKCIAANAVFSNIIPKENIKQEHATDIDSCEIELKQELKIDDDEAQIPFKDDITDCGEDDDYYGERDNELSYDNSFTYELVLKNEAKANVKSEDINKLKRKTKNVKKKAPSDRNGGSKGIKKTKKTKKKSVSVKKLSGQKFKINNIGTKKTEAKGPKKILEKKLPCGLCSKSFEDKSQLDAHLSTHKQGSCSICEEKCVDWQELMAHRVKHLPKGRYPCHLCHKKCLTAVSLEHHFRKNHHTEGERQELRCRLCSNRFFATPRRLRVHVIDSHNLKNRRFYCDICNKLCTTRALMKSHLASHLDHKPFRCDLCDYASKYGHGLRLHKMARHNPDRVYCVKCKNVYPSQARHDKHVCTHADSICPMCGKICTSKSTFRRHMRSHEAVPVYACSRCPARFRAAGTLRVHMDKHAGVPRHACEFCPAKFYFPSVLTKHRRTHTGIKPYVCEVCEKAFTGKSNLKVHMKVHGKFIINKRIKNDDESYLQVAPTVLPDGLIKPSSVTQETSTNTVILCP